MEVALSSPVLSVPLPSLATAVALRGGGVVVAATATAAGAAAGAGIVAWARGLGSDVNTETLLGIKISPEGKSVFFMAAAMAFHYLGYSLARPVTVALFTSASTGYAGYAGAFPFAMAFVSPTALLLLLGYGRLLEKYGPRGALMRSTSACASIVAAAAAAIAVGVATNYHIGGIPLVKLVTGPLFVFRESYVQLLTSQYWSFMASVLTPSQSAKWFGPIAGLTSIASAVAGMAVSPIVDKVGLEGALLGTSLTLLLSLIGAAAGYRIADKHGFTPMDIIKKKKAPVRKDGKSLSEGDPTIVEKATRLFKREPVLWRLFLEILASQGLATILNICFVARLGSAIPNDAERAGWVGVFFAVINMITMVFQFAILPPLLTFIEPRDLWRALPIVSLLTTGFQTLKQNPSLNVVAASLLVMKVSEYSARRMLDEMVFVPLDFESRFVGKEVIGVFGYRFGKSLMSLGLSGLTTMVGEFGLQQLSVFATAVSVLWLQTAWSLSNLVPTRAEAEAAHLKLKKGKKPRPAPPKRKPVAAPPKKKPVARTTPAPRATNRSKK